MITKFKDLRKSDKCYWLLKNDEFFNARLYKIGMPIDYIKDYQFRDKTKSYYIGCVRDYDYHIIWNFSSTPYSEGVVNQYEFMNYEYMGEVELIQDDIDKYEMFTNIKKYNI